MKENGDIEKEAVHGQKMVEIRLRFWTNDIAEGKGKIIPGHAWSSGVVRIEPNESHDIERGECYPFNSLLEVGKVIEQCLIDHDITLHPSSKMRKYFESSR